MPRWLRIIRGMIGTGLAFSAGVGAIGGVVSGLIVLFSDRVSLADLPGVLGLAARFAVIAFPVGVAFSGALALFARRREFGKLSLPLFGTLGAGAGVLLFLLLGFNGAFAAWSTGDAIANFVTLALLGAGAATGTLIVARRARPALDAPNDALLESPDPEFSVPSYSEVPVPNSTTKP